MSSKYFELLDPPTFIVCDDVRNEVGGKVVLVGVYPGNVIVLRNFPAKVTSTVWTVFWFRQEGSFEAQFRHRMQDGTVGGTGVTSFINAAKGKLTTCKLEAPFELSDPQMVEVQLRFPDEDWTTIGRFCVDRVKQLT